MQRHFWGTILLSLVIGAGHSVAQTAPPDEAQAPPPAEAQQAAQQPPPGPPPTPPVTEGQPPPAGSVVAEEPGASRHAFVQIFGNWGVNLGRTDYVPDVEPGTSKHPFANGFGGGATVGLTVIGGWLSLIADYRFGETRTRKGSIEGVLTEAQGRTHFHQFTAGLRIERPLGYGDVYAQMAGGAMLGFHTTREIVYAPQLAAIGLMGEGTVVENFGIGVGVMAELGFNHELTERLFVGIGLRLAAFQANNAGHETEITNFVLDFEAMPPTPVTTTIHHGTNAPETPTTYSIQDVRLNLSIGYRF